MRRSVKRRAWRRRLRSPIDDIRSDGRATGLRWYACWWRGRCGLCAMARNARAGRRIRRCCGARSGRIVREALPAESGTRTRCRGHHRDHRQRPAGDTITGAGEQDPAALPARRRGSAGHQGRLRRRRVWRVHRVSGRRGGDGVPGRCAARARGRDRDCRRAGGAG